MIEHCQICGFYILPDALERYHLSDSVTITLCANCHRTLETALHSLYGKGASSRKAALTDPQYWNKLHRIISVMQMKYKAQGHNVPKIDFLPAGNAL